MSEHTAVPQEDGEIDLLPAWQKFVAHKVAVTAIVLICMGGFAVWNKLRAPLYEASAAVIVPAKAQASIGLSSALGLGLPDSSPTGMIESILQSEHALETVAEIVELDKKKLRDKVNITRVRGAEVVEIHVKDKDQERAVAAAEAYISVLAQMFADLNVPSKSEDVSVLADALEDRKSELAQADEELKSFNESAATDAASATVFQGQLSTLQVELNATAKSLEAAKKDVAEQAAVAMDSPVDLAPASKWREKLVDLEYELAIALTKYGSKHPAVGELQAGVDKTKGIMQSEIEAYAKAVLSGLIDPTGSAGGSQGENASYTGLQAQHLFLQAKVDALAKIVDKIPAEDQRRRALARDVETLTEVVKQLTVQLEQAALNKNVDPNRWEVLDEPHLADKPVNKSYSKSLALGLILGIVLGAGYAVTRKR